MNKIFLKTEKNTYVFVSRPRFSVAKNRLVEQIAAIDKDKVVGASVVTKENSVPYAAQSPC